MSRSCAPGKHYNRIAKTLMAKDLLAKFSVVILNTVYESSAKFSVVNDASVYVATARQSKCSKKSINLFILLMDIKLIKNETKNKAL